MVAPSEISWDMYDPRTTVKATADEDMTRGECCYLHTDGKARLCDNGKSDEFVGCALKDYDEGDKAVLVTHGRLNVTTTQTIGALAKVPNTSGGGPPDTAGGGSAEAGVAIGANLIAVHGLRGEMV